MPPEHAPFPLQGSGTHGSTTGTNISDNLVFMISMSKWGQLNGTRNIYFYICRYPTPDYVRKLYFCQYQCCICRQIY